MKQKQMTSKELKHLIRRWLRTSRLKHLRFSDVLESIGLKGPFKLTPTSYYTDKDFFKCVTGNNDEYFIYLHFGIIGAQIWTFGNFHYNKYHIKNGQICQNQFDETVFWRNLLVDKEFKQCIRCWIHTSYYLKYSTFASMLEATGLKGPFKLTALPPHILKNYHSFNTFECETGDHKSYILYLRPSEEEAPKIVIYKDDTVLYFHIENGRICKGRWNEAGF